MTRVAAVDIGTNSTRLLVADVEDRVVTELGRRLEITRLGEGVDERRILLPHAIARVRNVLADYRRAAEEAGAARTLAFATSAARDAANSAAFIAELRERFDLSASVLSGEEEAELTYLGARGSCADCETVVVDIGGGSTELVVGSGGEPTYNASLQLGVVRHTERHLHNDPPLTNELESLAEDVGGTIDAELVAHPGLHADRGIAVAGTPAILAAMDLSLDRVDYTPIEGHELDLETVQKLLSRLASLPVDERRAVRGVDPDRAPTIVAGVIILIQVMRAFGLTEIEASEHDILWGAALEAAV